MTRHSYRIEIGRRVLEGFEFVVGPMSAVSIPQPPRKPEAFVLAAYRGGATPIVGPRDIRADTYIEDIVEIRRGMGERFFGANVICVWSGLREFLNRFQELGREGADLLDVNASELNFAEFLPLLRPVEVPIDLVISQPASLHAFMGLLKQKGFSFLLDRIVAGSLRLTLPRNRGGGHLPVLFQSQEKPGWLDALLAGKLEIERELGVRVPFIVEKGMITVDDFVSTLVRYAPYPGFSGIRFASNLELSIESGLNEASKAFLAGIVRERRREAILPIRSGIAAGRKGSKIRGGLIIYAAATQLARRIHEMQCQGKEYPQYARAYQPAIFRDQMGTTEGWFCPLCNPRCPKEYCEIRGSAESVLPGGGVDDALIFVSPRIVEIDPRYIDASATFVVQDLIRRTLARLGKGNLHGTGFQTDPPKPGASSLGESPRP